MTFYTSILNGLTFYPSSLIVSTLLSIFLRFLRCYGLINSSTSLILLHKPFLLFCGIYLKKILGNCMLLFKQKELNTQLNIVITKSSWSSN